MTSINNNITSGSYYSLGNQKAEEGSEVKATSLAASLTSTADTSALGAFNIDLSPEAKAYLASVEREKMAQSVKSSASDYGFTLNSSQKKQLDAIIDKYKDSEYNQVNYELLQLDLREARLDSLNLAAKDLMSSFSSTNTLLAALSGNTTGFINADERMANQQNKSETYMDQIVKDWLAKGAKA